MDQYESLSHSRWKCRYHVSSKCPRKSLYGELRRSRRSALGDIGRTGVEPTGAFVFAAAPGRAAHGGLGFAQEFAAGCACSEYQHVAVVETEIPARLRIAMEPQSLQLSRDLGSRRPLMRSVVRRRRRRRLRGRDGPRSWRRRRAAGRRTWCRGIARRVQNRPVVVV